MEVSWWSQISTEVKLENTGVKPVMSVAMHQRRQQLKCSVSYFVFKQYNVHVYISFQIAGFQPPYYYNWKFFIDLIYIFLFLSFLHYAYMCTLWLVSKRSDFQRNILKYEKNVTFWKLHNFRKGMDSYVFNVGLNWKLSQMVGFNERLHFFSIKETGCTLDIFEILKNSINA